MATYRRETLIDAPFEEVWTFHSSTDGLEALTPNWMGLEIERVVGPDGTRDPEELEAGSRIEMSVRPFGVGPRRTFASRIVDRTREGNTGSFRDVMESGPFAEWTHTHRVSAVGDRTRLIDRIAYRLPGDLLGRALSPLGRLGLAAAFLDRHRRTKLLLEGDDHASRE